VICDLKFPKSYIVCLVLFCFLENYSCSFKLLHFLWQTNELTLATTQLNSFRIIKSMFCTLLRFTMWLNSSVYSRAVLQQWKKNWSAAEHVEVMNVAVRGNTINTNQTKHMSTLKRTIPSKQIAHLIYNLLFNGQV